MGNLNVSILDTPSGKYLVYSSADGMGRILLTEGIHEKPVIEASRLILSASVGTSVLDLGANIGSYTIPLAKRFPGLNFFCFEIQRNVFYQLCGNIFLNGLMNVRAFNKGVSSTSGEIEIPEIDYSKCWNVGGYSIDQTALSADRVDFPSESIIGSVPAEVSTLDSFETSIKNIALIKIDVEGHEIEVLKGALNIIEANGFPPIIFECWPFDWFEEKKTEIFEYFNKIGYTNISPDIGSYNYLAQSPESDHPGVILN